VRLGGRAGWGALFDGADETFLAFTCDPAAVPFVGICLMRGGWPETGEPSYSVILEPCNGWPDRLDLAITRGDCAVIPPRGERLWQVSLHLGRGPAALDAVIGRPS
jgi:hypothetical protein